MKNAFRILVAYLEPWFAKNFAMFSADPDAPLIAVHSVGVDHGKEGISVNPLFLDSDFRSEYLRGWFVGHDFTINRHITEVV